jgi:hypothetical protein
MKDEQVNAAIEDIERALAADDPGFVHRVRVVRRDAAINFVTVFVLLAAGAVLLTVGLATSEWVPWSIGVAMLIFSVLIDDHHRHRRR